MKKTLVAYFVFSSVLIPRLMWGQKLSRAEAVARSVQANPEVLKSRDQIKLLEGRVKEAKADAMPDINLAGSSLRYTDPSFLNSPSFDSFPAEFRSSLSPTASNLFDGAVSVRQTLYSFKLNKAIKAARMARTLGQEDLVRAQRSIALNTIQAYNDLVFALEQVRVAQDAVSRKEKHLDVTRNRRAAGVATELEVFRTEVDLANQRAQLVRIEGNVDLARASLNAIMLRPIDDPLEPTDKLEMLPFDSTLDDIVREAIASRPEIKVAVLTSGIRSELIGIAQAESRPSFEFVGNYGYSTRKPTNFFDQNFSKWNTAVTVKIPIFQGFRTTGRVEQAKAEYSKSLLDTVALKNQISLQAREAYVRLNVAAKLVAAAEMNVKQARKALDMTQANYNYGAATLLDVTDAQTALIQAESTLNEGLHEHANARAALRFIMGRELLD